MTNQPNPLVNHFRSPKLYVKLPSGTSLYSEDVIEIPESGEIPIFPMTAKDEIMVKNPDALLNGEATTQLLMSCCPNIKKPLDIYAPDVDALLVAITGASNDDDIPINAPCPKCQEVCEITLSAENVLELMGTLEESYKLNVGDELVIELRPYTYRSTVKAGLANFQSTRSLQALTDIPDDLDRLKLFNENFVRLASSNFELLVDSVQSITILNKDKDIVVTDRMQILEFLENCDGHIGKTISEETNTINNIGIADQATFECEKCEETFENPISFDPVNFFMAS